MHSWVCRFSVLLLLISLLGCGSSGGGGSGTGDPIEAEVGETIDALVKDIESLDAQKVSENWLDMNGKCFRTNVATPETMPNLKDRLNAFFQKVKPQSLTFQIKDRGIESLGENGAQMLGDLVVTYTPVGAEDPVTMPSEKLNLYLERVGKWGVISFGSSHYPTSFPPQL
ncbi:MAG TPA: hypothetical protein PKO06_09225 [Candidatus Ozemobacteraceae bacterium]|nr:hypothetical protein [Candidatus Ozemobacteraceae bacterium]